MLEEAIAALTSLGLSQGEAKTYIALVAVGTSEATPLAEQAKVPQPRVYSYLDTLEQKNMVKKTEVSGKPNRYSAVPYEVAISQLEKELTSKIEQTKQFLKKKQGSSPVSEGETVRLFEGDQSVRTGLMSLAATSSLNVHIINHQFFDKFIENYFSDIKVVKPIDQLKNSPIIKMIENNGIAQIWGEKRIMLLIEDLNPVNQTCRSVNIVAYPGEEADINPVMIQIRHPLILDLQVSVILSFFTLLGSKMSP